MTLELRCDEKLCFFQPSHDRNMNVFTIGEFYRSASLLPIKAKHMVFNELLTKFKVVPANFVKTKIYIKANTLIASPGIKPTDGAVPSDDI